ncbi:VWA domain-containing protein [Methanofollis formosanus]|uniref:VWA domain-containing protein n=1 Tax=Methanofollis formosanus TaxID=299308 RepID=A0A8G0ZZX2_9EURY|nr:VWA domain-containing protein [Methanofollis formosanus]QYZ78500.1 VWA domain-containing protein [Methanofollis formosanus]
MAGFSHPLWLLGLLGLPVLYLLYLRAEKRRKKEALLFSGVSILKEAIGETKPSRRPQVLFLLTLLAVALLITGLAGPHVPLEGIHEGVSVVLAIDTSGSMAATDYPPDRLSSAKSAAEKLLDGLESEDYAGVVIFENGAMSAAYLSPDHERVIGKLQAIKPRDGPTALGDGLALAVDMADAIPNRKKVVVILSDGMNNAGIISPAQAAGFAVERGVRVYTVGLGSAGPVAFGTAEDGSTQYARLDEKTLREVAATTGGKYFRSVDGDTLQEIYAALPAEIEREPEETDVAGAFFVAAVLVLLAECWLRYGRGRILP